MKLRMIKLCSLLTALVLLIGSVATLAESGGSGTISSIENQNKLGRAHIEATVDTTDVIEVGRTHKVIITSGNTAVVDQIPTTFRVYFSSTEPSTVYCNWFANGNKEWKIDEVIYYLKSDDNGKQYIEYTLNAGDTVIPEFEFIAPNGISGKEQTLTVEPTIVIPDAFTADQYSVGEKVTASWKGEFNWDNVKKSAFVINSSISNAQSLSVTQDDKLSGDILYTISNVSHNHDHYGEVWTNDITFTDELVVPDGVILPENCTYDLHSGVIKDADNNTTIFSLNLAQLEGASVTSLKVEGQKICFTVTSPNTKLSATDPDEIKDPEFYATLHATNLKVDPDKKTVLENKNIDNKVDFVANAYNCNEQSKSSATVSTPIKASAANTEIYKEIAEQSLKAGATANYTITVKNTGDTDKTDSKIRDWLPPGMYLTQQQEADIKQAAAAEGMGFTYDSSKREMLWQNVTIKGHDEIKINFEAQVADANTLMSQNITEFKNKASIDWTKEAEVTTPCEKPTLEIKKEVSENRNYSKDEFVTYNLTAMNTSSVDATNVPLTDTLPKGLTLIGDDNKPITETPSNPVNINGKPATVIVNQDGTTTVRWVQDVAANTTLPLTLKAKVNQDGVFIGSLYNKFQAPGKETGVTINVNRPTLNLAKDHTGPDGNGVLTYTLKATNYSEYDAENVVITDTMPKGLIPTDSAGKRLDPGENTLSNGLKVHVVYNSDGTSTLTWTELKIEKETSKEYTLYAKVDDLSDYTGNTALLTNSFSTNYGGYGHDDYPAPRPNPEIDKTIVPDQFAQYSAGDIVTFKLTASNDSTLPTTTFTMWDTLPSGLELVNSNGTVIPAGTANIGGYQATVTQNTDGTTRIEWNLGEVAASARIEIDLYAKVKPYVVNTTTLTNHLNDCFNHEKTVDVQLKPLRDFDKKILLADGTETDFSMIKEGGKVTYILKLINRSSDQAVEFKEVYDYLPDHFSKFSYVKDSTDPSKASVTIRNYTGSTYTVDGKEYTVHPLFDANDGISDRTFANWKTVTVPAGTIAISLMDVTYPKGENWEAFKTAYFNQSNRLENKFHCDIGDKKVYHDIEMETGELYMRKGVYELSTANSSGQFVKDNRKGTDSSLRQYVYNDQYPTRGAYVLYYVSIVNTGKNPVVINTLEDKLPPGVQYIGMNANDAYMTIDSSNTWGDCNSKEITVEGHQGDYFSFLENEKNYPSSVSIRSTCSDGTVTFTFPNNPDGFKMQPGTYLNFIYACNITASAGLTSTNTLTLKTKGLVDEGYNDTPRDHLDGRTPNDGSCTYVGYNGTETIFTSSVTIERAEDTTTPTRIVPGITKQVTHYYEGHNSTKAIPIDSQTQLSSSNDLGWTVTLYNSGVEDMPVKQFTDAIDYPYQIVGDPVLTLEGNKYKLTNASRSAPATNYGESTTYTYGLYITDENTLTLGNAPANHVGDEGYLVIPHGKTATVYVRTRNTANGTKTGLDYFNKATLTPYSAFKKCSDGVLEGANDDGTYTSVSARDSVIFRKKFATVSNKRVEEADNPSNYTTSYDVSEAADNYIILPEGNHNVFYTLSVTNNGQYPLSDLVLIDNLPHVGDVGSVYDAPRGSQYSISFANIASVTIQPSRSHGYALSNHQDYKVEFSDKTSFTKEDYRGATAGWSGNQGSARSFRLMLTREGGLPSGATLKVRFKATVPDNVEAGKIAWNTFGYYAAISDDAGTSGAYASPPRVGVATNQPPTTTSFSFIKTDAGGTTPLEGAEFVLVDELSGEELLKVLNEAESDLEKQRELDKLPAGSKAASDGEGKVTFSNLLAGTYMLIETKAPEEYKLPDGYWKVTISATEGDGFSFVVEAQGDATPKPIETDGTIKLPNGQDKVEIPELPSVGGLGTHGMMLGGALAMLMAIALLAARKKARKEEGNC